ncbi:unnamed protein product [Angiostrongylus costaricensis]|uniref:Uncharacterized protein n=1 Tax=Angiostrongylus costaricensis TaxID=334426 RepID=A0A0R3PJQ2_ANGCS|nr:unnamed protein product [Angiostrongylus costaricensis]
MEGVTGRRAIPRAERSSGLLFDHGRQSREEVRLRAAQTSNRPGLLRELETQTFGKEGNAMPPREIFIGRRQSPEAVRRVLK